ncbi:hypothetical protein [Hyalangium sp.]|uniref:hypothetical protein n=1 Tax=Hyalangium sp. TaxID=2028555 RepID=UPI002D27C213|nr:hypothetical protein [Hyalangium sp.]HYI01162.1 hypothetical protein [Hyalangium sp.]
MRTLLALLMIAAAAPALGQDSGTPKKKKVIRLDALTVEGKIQKPQAFYILQRSNLNFEELNKPESFVPKVVQSVDKQPF